MSELLRRGLTFCLLSEKPLRHARLPNHRKQRADGDIVAHVVSGYVDVANGTTILAAIADMAGSLPIVGDESIFQ
jgi:hypothetical protein